MIFKGFPLLALSCTVFAAHHGQKVIAEQHEPPNFIQASIFGHRAINIASLPEPVTLPPTYQNREFDDDAPFQGIGTFAHIEFTECTKSENSGTFDIGIVGHPFDLGVSYRPGARFGPNGARQGSRRLSPLTGWE